MIVTLNITRLLFLILECGGNVTVKLKLCHKAVRPQFIKDFYHSEKCCSCKTIQQVIKSFREKDGDCFDRATEILMTRRKLGGLIIYIATGVTNYFFQRKSSEKMKARCEV